MGVAPLRSAVAQAMIVVYIISYQATSQIDASRPVVRNIEDNDDDDNNNNNNNNNGVVSGCL